MFVRGWWLVWCRSRSSGGVLSSQSGDRQGQVVADRAADERSDATNVPDDPHRPEREPLDFPQRDVVCVLRAFSWLVYQAAAPQEQS